MTGNDEEPTTHRSPFGIEVDRREALLAALPGKLAYEWFESLKRATQVFNGNTVDLQRHLAQFVGTTIHVNHLPDDFDVEANRLLHNYVAAMATLRDIQRSIHRQLWPEPHDDDDDRVCPTCGRRDPKRTKWQVEVWEPKTAEQFGDDAIRFLGDLRNFSLHYSIPPVTLTTNWHAIGGGPMQWQNIVALNRDELLKFSSWSGAARRYINTHDGDIEFWPVIAMYSTRVRTFASWFYGVVEDKVRSDLAEYIAKNNEFRNWQNVEATWGRFAPDGRRVQFPKVAEARRLRATAGTCGWRLIAPDENGEWAVGESDWPPLPRGPR
jgi:hypothetical protein